MVKNLNATISKPKEMLDSMTNWVLKVVSVHCSVWSVQCSVANKINV